MFRPLGSAMDASPAPLRFSLRAAAGGLDIEFVAPWPTPRSDALFTDADCLDIAPSSAAEGADTKADTERSHKDVVRSSSMTVLVSKQKQGHFRVRENRVRENRDAPAELAHPRSVAARLAAVAATPPGHRLPNPENPPPRSATRYANPTPSAAH